MKNPISIILAVAGGVIGVAIVRYYFMNTFEIIGWNLFWNNLSHLNFDMFKLIFKSATFGKCLVGFLIGGAAGFVVGMAIGSGKK